ncbi:MAG: cysteine desulfurase [Elusimicrobia bacterium]|nr:cysteine desulfurase [Elusimicrobiota bacterium]
MRKSPVYLDHNASTPVRPEVLEAMLPYLKGEFGNPNSVYFLGQRARKAVENARAQVAALLGAAEDEIVFTSCGSESDVAAIAGAAWQAHDESRGAKKHIVSSAIEHDAVRGLLGELKRRDFSVSEAPVDGLGLVSPAAVEALINGGTSLVSIMHANNEVGTIQPIEALSALCRARGALFHTDAVQSAGKIPLDVKKLGVDLLSISGHKINAPKGIGALYARRGIRLSPLITGHQEKNRRGGTENVASIVGLGKACELALKELSHSSELLKLRNKLEEGVLRIPGSRLNGHPTQRLPNGAHFSFQGLDGHQLVIALDMEGICVSSGPACSSGSSLPSHVLTAMGVDPELATGSLRISMGWSSTEADIARLLEALPPAVDKLRRIPAGSR